MTSETTNGATAHVKTHPMITSMAGLEPRIERALITPDLAKKWLGQNTSSNRRISPRTVFAYAREMKAGRWQVTHQGIAFNRAGELIDGQHRLNAVVAADTPVEMIVYTGMPLEYNAPIDQGYNRRIDQILGITSRLGSAARALWALENNHVSANFRSSLGAIEEVVGREGKILRTLGEAAPSKFVGGPMIGALAYAWPIHPDKVLNFARQVHSGELLERGDPAWALRNWIIRVVHRSSRENIVALCNAMTYELKGKKLGRIAHGRNAETDRKGISGYKWLSQKRRALGIPFTPAYVAEEANERELEVVDNVAADDDDEPAVRPAKPASTKK